MTAHVAGDRAGTFVSLFCGCGGFDAGFASAGFTCVGAFDIDPLAVAVHTANLHARHPGVHRPATVADLAGGLPPGVDTLAPDVVLAGSPCQGFSTIGRRDVDDPRNNLLLTAGHAVLVLRPKVFVAENVAGVTAGGHGRYWRALTDMLRTAGYQTVEMRVRGIDHGVPQVRRRVLLLAWSADRLAEPRLTVTPGGVLRDVIGDLVAPATGTAAPATPVANHDRRPLVAGTPAARIAVHIGEGQKLTNVRAGPRSVHTWDIPEVYGATTEQERMLLHALRCERRKNRLRDTGDADPVTATVLRRATGPWADTTLSGLVAKRYVRKVGRHRYDLTHTFNGKYRRLAWEAETPAVDTKWGEARLVLHPAEDRPFTVREAARVQGFEDTFVFHGGVREQFRLVGNAVPPPLARSIGLCVQRILAE